MPMQPIQIPKAFCFNAPIVSISIPEKPKPIKPTLCQRIGSFVKKIWNHLCFWQNNSPFNLSGRQIKLIRQEKVDRTLSEVHTVTVVKSKPKELPKPYQPGVQKKPTLFRLSEFLESFTQFLVNECALEEVINPALPDLKDSLLEIVSELKKWNITFKNLRDNAAPLLQKLKKLDDPIITLVAQQLLHLILQGEGDEAEKKETLKTQLKTNLKQLKDKNVISDEHCNQADDLIDPILNWLFHSNNWLLNSKQPINLHHFFSDTFRYIETLITEIDNDKLADQLAQFKKFTENDLESAVNKLLELNTQPLTAFFFGRIADLIEHLPYTETFDEILKMLIKQMEGWKAANDQCKEQKALIDASQKAVTAQPANSLDVAKKSTAMQQLSFVEKDGGEEPYLENKFLRAFTDQPVCHEKVSQWINTPTQHEQQTHLDELFLGIVDELIPHFLPLDKIQIPEGANVDLNGIARIGSLIQLPDSLKEIQDLGLQLFEKILEKSEVKDKENFRNYFNVFGKTVMTEVMHNQIRHELKLKLKDLFQRLSNKEYIDYLFSKYIFPYLIDLTFDGYVRAYIDKKSSIIAVYFHAMFEGEKQIGIINQGLLDYLYEEIKNDFMDFSMDDANISKERFNVLIQPLITEIYNHIKELKEENPVKRLTEENVKSKLHEYFKAESVPVNKDYGKLIMSALFGIGNFGGPFVEKITGWFQGPLCTITSQSLHTSRDNYHLVVNAIIDSASENLLDQEKVKEIFFQPEPSNEELIERAEFVKEEFPKQLHTIAAIAHDSIYRSVQNKGLPSILNFSPKTEKLETVIGDVFNRLLKHDKLNTNLLVSCTKIFHRRLTESVVKLNAHMEINKRAEQLV